ncbi:DBH-like monooxygenase protein 2 homolog [Oryzias melastigma]|uniref:Monooxygenase, DBH-like 1, like n=1 Tax=Oryzias melastigma TaxID=30732 RepID=A0A3B3DD06_ORYME|nr:DBH-like monooxygenase protein 2 homolog [Oryzias melastigma]
MFTLLLLRLLSPVLLAWTGGTSAADDGMPFMEYLDPNHLVCLKWGFDNAQGEITFELAVNSTGWIGFGLSRSGEMYGADIVIGGVGPNGNYFNDYHAIGEFMPSLDREQSYTLLSMVESDGQTIMTFRRAIQSCDEEDYHITAKPIKLIYAYGTSDDIKYHGPRRGTKEVNLLNYMPRTSNSSAKYLSAKVTNVSVPSNKTYYHCKVMKISDLSTKHHIYQIEPDIENPDVVHHMLLYHCPPTVTEPYENQCYMGDKGDKCFGVLAAWGTGGGVYELPENAGIPIGGPDNDILYRLEIHYNNPQQKAGIIDNSGLKLYYTDQLRKHNVGILNTGMLPILPVAYTIPPNAAEFHSYGLCNTSYFSQFVSPMPDLQVFAVLLHTHLAGRKIRVGHFRNGKQIDFLGLDENYNFEMQQTVTLGSIKTVMQGDEIIVECTYDTKDRTGPTKIGLSTYDEMCLAFLYYYPAISVTSCLSQPNTTLLSTTYNQSPDPEEHAVYEEMLKNLPQVQYISDAKRTPSVYINGFIREMMASPTVECQHENAAKSLCSSWIANIGGVILSLLWMIV